MYLAIRNPGVADHYSFTLIGASTSRHSSNEGTVGQFGSGSKYATALLLRKGIRPVIIAGNLKMDFDTNPVKANGRIVNQVQVAFSGKLLNGKTKNTTEDLGYVAEMGEMNWTSLGMALREFVANALDGALASGFDHTAVSIEIVDKPRAKAGHTTVYIPYTPEIEACHKALNVMFLHLGDPKALKNKILPKREGFQDTILIYKKGVLAKSMTGKSLFDYNLGDELTLDESRNAETWDVNYAVAKALRDANAEELTQVIRGVVTDPNCWEAKLPSSYLQSSNAQEKEKRSAVFQTAFKSLYGEKAVATSGITTVDSFVQGKGFKAIPVNSEWLQTLESYAVPSSTSILDNNEMKGRVVENATKEQTDAVQWAYNTLKTFNLTNGKDIPPVKSFQEVMNSGSQTWGEYLDETIYLHKELGGNLLKKVALEELVHHVTGATDGSRDIQDFLFRLVVEMAG